MGTALAATECPPSKLDRVAVTNNTSVIVATRGSIYADYDSGLWLFNDSGNVQFRDIIEQSVSVALPAVLPGRRH